MDFDMLEHVRFCLRDMISKVRKGMKAMILDDTTTSIVSVAIARSEMLLEEVYIFQRIEDLSELTNKSMKILKALVILRPTSHNIQLLCHHLRKPIFREYYVYFTSRINPIYLETLAKWDECEVVKDIGEYPIDLIAISPRVFTLNMFENFYSKCQIRPEHLERASDSLLCLMVALKLNPVIRYQKNSNFCNFLADQVHEKLNNEKKLDLDYNKNNPYDKSALLLILDRRLDTASAIINKWTYQAMIHEQFRIVNNRISLAQVPDLKQNDPKELILSTLNDDFFSKNRHLNYGEIGFTLKTSIDDLKSRTQSQRKVETMGDMRRFIEEYPETRRLASNVHNHVLVLGELSRIVNQYNLVQASELEQEILCGTSSNRELLNTLRQIVSASMLRPLDAMRLVALYTTSGRGDREGADDLEELFIARKDVTQEQIKALKIIRSFSTSERGKEIGTRNKIEFFTRKITKGIRGVDNVFTQYQPVLKKILDNLGQSKSIDDQFPTHTATRIVGETRKLIVFFVGGMTFEEALCIERNNHKFEAIIGGTAIHNFESFVEEITKSDETD